MAHSEFCPVCKGFGKLYEPPPEGSSSRYGNYSTCHGCDGYGWVTVQDKPIDPAEELTGHMQEE